MPDVPLPILFIGSEKTQIRQIPLVRGPPYPFRFLLELGGMIVVENIHPDTLLRKLKQFLNNHPQYELLVHAAERPDGSIALFTYHFCNLEVPRRIT